MQSLPLPVTGNQGMLPGPEMTSGWAPPRSLHTMDPSAPSRAATGSQGTLEPLVMPVLLAASHLQR